MTSYRPRVADPNPIARALAAEKVQHAVEHRRAALLVAHQSVDAEDCAQLLSMLGLDAGEADEVHSPA